MLYNTPGQIECAHTSSDDEKPLVDPTDKPSNRKVYYRKCFQCKLCFEQLRVSEKVFFEHLVYIHSMPYEELENYSGYLKYCMERIGGPMMDLEFFTIAPVNEFFFWNFN